jgi:metal-responsive CopG/Arc/MetJ family transcriptional regulator
MVKEKKYAARVTVAIEQDLLEKLEDLSREKGVSLAGLIRMAVREWLKSGGGKA